LLAFDKIGLAADAHVLRLCADEREAKRHVRGRHQQSRKSSRRTLVFAEEYQYIEDAIAREKEIKGWRRSKKDALVAASNPTWADLLETSIVKGPSLRSG
jgi:putative endonuclease